MPVQGYSTGRDATLVITTPKGIIDVKILEFNSKQETKEGTIEPINGDVEHPLYFMGHSGSFKTQRNGPQVDDYFAQIEDDYFNGRAILPAYIQETIQEPDGSVSQWRFDKVTLQLADAGKYKADTPTEQTINFKAARKRRTA